MRDSRRSRERDFCLGKTNTPAEFGDAGDAGAGADDGASAVVIAAVDAVAVVCGPPSPEVATPPDIELRSTALARRLCSVGCFLRS